MKVLKTIMFILRFILGITFILSGFFKLTDPVGTSLIVKEYMDFLYMGFMDFASVPAGMLLSVAELLTGISLLTCIRIHIGSWVALIMLSFFTVLTFFVAVSDAMQDCGCFGQAIHLTLWQTFFKNLVLVAAAVPVFLFRNRFSPVAPVVAEWAFIGVFAFLALGFTLYSYIHIPLVEYGNFSVGSNIMQKYYTVTDPENFDTYFVYEKDGNEELFTIDSLPDDTWTYVDTENIYKGRKSDLLFDMTLSDTYGMVVTEKIINSSDPEFLFVLHDPEDIPDGYWPRLEATVDSVLAYGMDPYILLPGVFPASDSIIRSKPSLAGNVLYGDYKTLIAMNRSNGGLVCIDDGVVVKKWAGWKFRPGSIRNTLEKDSEEVAARGIISQRIFYESTLILIFLIIILFRYVCGIIYGRKR